MAVFITGGQAAIEYDENTLLLLHGETVKDSSMFGRAITNNGVVASADQSKFGEKSLLFDGSTTSLVIAPVITENTEFTVDCWVYPTQNKTASIWTHGDTGASTGTGGSVLTYNGAWLYYCNGFLIQGGSVSFNKWQHLALVGTKTAIHLYVDGVLIGSTSGSYNFGSLNEIIGANVSSAGTENFAGYIDELRISNIARWTANFTPPTEPYKA